VRQVVKKRLHYRVIVTLKSGAAFEGVLWEQDREALVLRDTQAIPGPNQAPVPVDGELLVFVADVEYIQKPK